MNFLRKLFNLLFGRKKTPSTPQEKEDLCLLSFSMRKYPMREDLIDIYHLMLDEETKNVYITPNTKSKVLLRIVNDANLMASQNDDIELIRLALRTTIEPLFQSGIFKDKKAHIHIPHKEV